MSPVKICRVLGDPIRWRIIRLVSHDALCVCELAEILSMPQSTVSSHVQIIRRAGLLESEKCEKWTYFRVEAKLLTLLRVLEAGIERMEPAWVEDDRKTSERLAIREKSCCPGPRYLAESRRGAFIPS